MPNGKHGDHPLTDMLAHGDHPFPQDIEDMARQLAEIGGWRLLDELSYEDWFDLKEDKNVEQNRRRLQDLLAQHKK